MSCPLCLSLQHGPPTGGYVIIPEAYASFCADRCAIEKAKREHPYRTAVRYYLAARQCAIKLCAERPWEVDTERGFVVAIAIVAFSRSVLREAALLQMNGWTGDEGEWKEPVWRVMEEARVNACG